MSTGCTNTLLSSLAGQDGGAVMRNIYPYVQCGSLQQLHLLGVPSVEIWLLKFLVLPLPEIRCEEDYMPKSMV